MALINCPECGKEISDQVKSCPHCGYPLRKGFPVKIAAIVVAVVAIGVGGYFYNVKVVVPQKTYSEAVELFENEKYDEAEARFLEVKDYKEAGKYLVNIENERIYQEAVAAWNNKNLDHAEKLFDAITAYQDSADYLTLINNERTYQEAVTAWNNKDLDHAEKLFDGIKVYENSEDYLTLIGNERVYQEAVIAWNNKELDHTEELFGSIISYEDAADYLTLIGNERVYQEAFALYEEKEYTAASVIFETIAEYADVSDIIAKMEEDYAFNTGVDLLTHYAYYAQSVELLGCDLLDDITDIWYNCIHEKSSYFTDKYTKNAWGGYYDDFNMALNKYFISDDYKRASEKIKTGQTAVDELYSQILDLPESLSDAVSKAFALQSAYTSLVKFSLDVEGSLQSVNETSRTKHDIFNTTYDELKLVIPPKRKIDPSKEEVYDFRSVNYGMSVDQVREAEKNYESVEDYYSYGFLSYVDVKLEDGTYAEITYSMDNYRFLKSIWVELPAGTTEEEALGYVKTWYGDAFDGEEYIVREDANTQYMSVWVDVDDDDTTVFLNYLDEESYKNKTASNDEAKDIASISEDETEAVTEDAEEIETE